MVSAEVFVSEAPSQLTLVLEPASVRGQVTDGGDHQPIAGATLSVSGSAFPVAQATSDASGNFVLGVVPFDATGLVAVAGGYLAVRVALGPREGKPEPVLRIELHAGPPLEGDVLDSDNKPIRAHVVACEGQPYEASVDSADDGTFRLPAQAVGCDAVAMHDEMAPSDPATLVEGRRTTLRLGRGGTIAGVVLDDHGTSLDSFAVGVESFIPARGTTAPRRGAASFHGGTFRLERLVPGTYVLTAATAGFPPARSGPVVVRSDNTTDVRITIAAGGAIIGRVVDGSGAPLGGVELRFDLVSAVAGSDAVATTDGIGRYRLEGAPSGPLTLRAQKEGYRMKLVSGLSVASGHTATKDIVLTEASGGPGLELGGIGANISRVEHGIGIAAVFPGDPADRAGLRAGDRIARIDADDATGMSVVDAIQRLRGEPGTLVGISVERGGALLDVLVTRATVVH